MFLKNFLLNRHYKGGRPNHVSNQRWRAMVKWHKARKRIIDESFADQYGPHVGRTKE